MDIFSIPSGHNQRNWLVFTKISDWEHILHGGLEYQIEHHLFPDLTLLSYRKAMPLVKEICKKHQIPYIQESVWIRLQKTVDIMIGKTNMLVLDQKNRAF